MKRVRGIIKAVLVFLISLVGFLILVFVLINLQFSHHFVTQEINKIFTSSGIPVHINSVTKILPWSVYVQGVLIHGPAGDTIVYADKVSSGLKPLALTKKKLILKSVCLEKTSVNLLRNRGDDQLNIAAAFSSGTVIAPVDQNVKKKPLEISVADAEVKDLRFMMSDSVAGIYVSQDIKWIKIETKKMSLTEKTILVKSLGIEGVTGNITLNQVKAEKEISETGSPWNLGLGELCGANINFVFDDQTDKLKLDLLAGEIVIKATNTDLNNKIIDFDEVAVSHTSIVIRMDNQVKASTPEEKTDPGLFPWDIRGGIVKFQDVACRLTNYTNTSAYNPLSGFSFIGLGMKLSDLELNKEKVNAGIENLKFDLGNGFSMRDMNGKIGSHSGTTRIDLDIETANSRFNLEGLAERNLFDIIKDPAGVHKANLTIRKTEVSLADIYYFKPELQKIPGSITLSSQPVKIYGEIKLDGSILDLTSFSISQENSLGLRFKGKIDNIFGPQKAVCDLKINIDDIDNNWLKRVLAEVQPGASVPDYKVLALEGAISDSLMTPDFSIKIKSDLGNIDLEGSIDFGHDKFSVRSVIDKLSLGKILNNDIFGSLTGSGEINGSGIKGNSLNAEAQFLVDSLGFKGYNYKHAGIEFKIQPGNYSLKLNVNDPSLAIDMTAGMQPANPGLKVSATGKIEADLYNLHLYNDSLIVKGMVSADLSKYLDDIEADLFLSEMSINSPHDSIPIHKIRASLKSDSSRTKIVSDGDFLSASAYIEKPAKSIGHFVQSYLRYFSSLFDLQNADSIKLVSGLPSMNGKINISFSDAFRIFIPDTTLSFKDLSFSFKTNVADNTVTYGIKGSGIRFRMFEAESLNAGITDSAAIIDFIVNADNCLIGTQPANNIRMSAHFADWESLITLSAIDKQEELLYNLEINSRRGSNNIILKIPSGQLILNRTKWKMDSPDLLVIDLKTKAVSPSLKMHTENSSLAVYKDDNNGWQTYYLEASKVALASLFRPDILPGKPEFYISGSMNYGKNEALGDKLNADLQFGDLTWSDLAFDKITLKSFFVSDTSGNYNFEINARLDTSEINMKGKKQEKSDRNIDLQFRQIPVNTIQPFVTKYLSDLHGDLSGEFRLSSKKESDNLSGELLINNGKIRINTLNSSYRMPDEKISFVNKKMILNDFTVLDSLDNKLLVNGSVDFSNKLSVNTDLEIASSNLQVLNRKDDKNATFYGDVFIDSKLSIKGTVTSPVLKGKILLAKGTDIYFRQSENLNLSESGKVLTFTSRKSLSAQAGERIEKKSSLYNKSSVESVIEIDPATRINIEISKKMFNIDMVIKGGGELNYNMLVNGQVNMNGRYEISEGGANLKMVGWPNKAFRLTKGGSIRWDGNLENPDLKLEAINRVKSSYVNPVDNKERYVDFDVTLKISNRLSDMDVSFTINTQDQYLMSIINTLSPDEQMRQAITILLFETVDLPGISTSSSYMSEQVNQMVAAQLNSLTKTTIKGIDISFGIDTYTQGTSSGGEQTKTSLSYEVKRNLLNDRAKVEFSGIASGSSNQSNSSNTSLNNFSFEYRIDSAATKFLKVYNEHSYEDVFEGDVVKTGVGFTYRKNYPSLSDIWRKKEKVVKPVNPEK